MKADALAAARAAGGAAAAAGDAVRITEALRAMADLLEAQDDNAYRVAAYRRAALTVARTGERLRAIFDRQGQPGLEELPGVGPRIAAAVAEMLTTGHWQQLDRAGGDADPEALLRTLPGIGPKLAHRLHEVLGIETLEGLERAAHDGRLERLPGVGARRAAAIGAALAQQFDRRRARRPASPPAAVAPEPPVDWLLGIDRAYRAAAAAGTLRTIAPRRFNAEGKSWLPVLHTARGDWHFTALYSNTARAHELGRTRDWVVIYGEDATHGERQYTVVTAPRGPLAGRRVVRGREADCSDWYRQHGADDAPAARRC